MKRLRSAPLRLLILALLCLGSVLRAQDTWSIIAQDVTRQNLWGVAYGAGTLVAVGEQGTILSYNYADQAWLPRTSDSSAWLVGVGYGADRFVAVGDSGTVLTSDDHGTTWQPRSSGVTTRLNAVAYGGGRWLAVGEQGTVLVSSDGTTWTRGGTPTTGFLRGLAYYRDTFYIGGAHGLLAASADGQRFGILESPAPNSDIEAIAVSGDRVWIGGSGGLLAGSLAAGTWTSLPAGFTTTFRALAARDNNEAVAASESESALYAQGSWRPLTRLPFLATAAIRGENEIVAVGFDGGLARIGVTSPPVTLASGRYVVVYGSDVTISATSVSSSEASYQWYKEGTAIPGATSLSLSLSRVTPADTGAYQLRFVQAGTPFLSQSTTVRVLPAGRPEVRDPTFVTPPGIVPSATVIQADGKMIFFAYFPVSPAGGAALRVARLNPDGSLDPVFHTASALPSTAWVSSLTLLPDGRIYVLGSFTSLDGHPFPGLARLLPDGAIDPSFHPDPAVSASAYLRFSPDGKIYGQSTNSPSGTIFRFSSDGTRDSAFPGLANHLLVDADRQGRIIAMRQESSSAYYLTRLLATGVSDPSYTETRLGYMTSFSYPLYATKLTDNGLYALSVGYGRFGPFYGFSRYYPDGGLDSKYISAPTVPYPNTGGVLFSFAYEADGSLWTAMSEYGGSNTTVTHFLPTGAPDPSRYANLPDSSFFYIRAVAPDGTLFVSTPSPSGALLTLNRLRPLVGQAGRLTNLSVRAFVASREEPLIAGFVTAGEGLTRALLRGIGPGLARFGVTDAARDPALTLTRNGATLLTNNDWAESLSPRFVATGAFALPPGSKDAALESDVSSGNYSAVVSPAAGDSGTVLAELFESSVPAPAPRRFINVSARGAVSPGRPLIAGFTITGDVPATVLIRGVGPALAGFGVPGTLPDPKLTLYRNDTILWENDNQASSNPNFEAMSAAAFQVGAFALTFSSKESAMHVTLPPGSYTAQVTGVADTSGTALIEVYEVR